MIVSKKCQCRGALTHALDGATRERIGVQLRAAELRGQSMLAGYYQQRLSACPTAAPSPKQRSVMAAAAERAEASR